jgi:cell wall-associated NlpC family hydrolase
MARPRRLLAAALAALALVALGALVASAASGDEPDSRALKPVDAPLPLPPDITRIAGEARVALDQAATREAQRRADAETRRLEAAARRAAETADPERIQTIAVPAPTASLDPEDADQTMVRAEVLNNGIALPPLESPPEVKTIIEAGNGIARTPYLWGGGHGKWQDKGYDCSGSVSFALASAGLLNRSLTSGQLEGWGEPGPGRWVTVWTNDGHVFLEVAGVRFDTTGRKTTGSRWQNAMRSRKGFVARHPPGL